jgi:hypothetical protein
MNVAIYREFSPKDCFDEVGFADPGLRAKSTASEVDGQDGMILTLPRTRMRNLRSYKQMERLYDETDIIGVSLKDTIND